MKKLMLVCAALAACSPRPAAPPAAPQPPSETTGGLEHGMLNCPVAVEGAETLLRMTDDGVDLIITAKDPAAQAEIVKLADFHARQNELSPWPEHTGKHGGPGTIGHCPVLHDGTQISLSPTEGGVILHVDALAPGRVKSVQEQTAERLSSMPKWLPRSAER